MADLPQPISYEQFLSDALSTYAAKIGISDYNVGGPATSFFEVMALIAARSSANVFDIVRDYSLDRATGDILKRIANENNIPPLVSKVASGAVSVTDTSFNKISGKIYAGAASPNIGSTTINVSGAGSFPASGSIYIGRGTNNVEGPIVYSSVTPTGGYYVLTLSSPTAKYHNAGETVIVAQGGVRSIPVNTIVTSPGIGTSQDIQYSVTAVAYILDGETAVNNVQISALIPGEAANAPIGAIKIFTSAPFSGATVTNPSPITTGQDNETDDQLRARIKLYLSSTGLGTTTAIQAALIGAQAPDEQASITSVSFQNIQDGVIVYVDDGKGYEEISTGVGIESIVDEAVGGEQYFQLATGGTQTAVAKAYLQSFLPEPYDLTGGDTLAVVVGETTYQHVFNTTDFQSPGAATAYEVTASLNADVTLGFEATTADAGNYVVIRAKEETNDSIQVTTPTTSGRDASVLLGFSSAKIETLRLYKNRIPLNKDGATASVFTQDQALWSTAIADGDTLILSVDGTQAITYVFNDSDFLATGLYGTVNASNSLASWVEVINNKVTGITASIVGSKIELTSNLGANSRASLVVGNSSTLVTKGMFTALSGLSSQGANSDFTLLRNTSQFKLTVPLSKGDKLQAGTTQSEGLVESLEISGGVVTLSSPGHVWILADSTAVTINTGVKSNTIIGVSKPATNTVRYTSAVPNAFSTVNVGDYVIIWSAELSAGNRLEGRVYAVTPTTLDLVVTSSEYASASVQSGILFNTGFVVARSKFAPQKFQINAGTSSLDAVALALQAQTSELVFSVLSEKYLLVKTNTKETDGSVLIVTSDSQGAQLNFVSGSSDNSKDSLYAFYNSTNREASFPSFVHSTFSSEASADPINSYISGVNSTISFAGRDPNELIGVLQPYGISDAQAYGEDFQVKSISGSALTIAEDPILRRLRINDRFFIANPLDFSSNDTIVAIVDNDAASGSFEIPLFRHALTNTGVSSNLVNFNAYDSDAGATASFAASFGSSFDFSNFKVLMQAKKVLKAQAAQTAILYRSVRWGRSGEKINVGYAYPSSANSDVTNSISIDSSVNITLGLRSGALVASSIDGTTEWNVTINTNNPSAGIDQVTYTWSGVGTNPNLTLTGGEYVNIGNQTELNPANTGVYRVSTQSGFTPTSTSFTVQRATGSAVAESNKATLVSNSIIFYEPASTTASYMASYVNAILPNFLSATLVNDGGTSGAGIIEFSTYEDTNFVSSSVYLKDGINWIASSNLSGSPQFTLKNNLALATDVGYAFNSGEPLVLSPTTIDQVQRFMNVLAVTGFTTVGTINQTERGKAIEFATDTLGSLGSIQVVGGAGNAYSVPVLDTGVRLDNQLMSASVDSVAGQGINSDQWLKLAATINQDKKALFGANTSITILSNYPTAGLSTIQLLNKAYNQRYLGKPRHNVRPLNLTFKVEKQGSLVCVSWNGSGSSPAFSKTVNFNSSGGGTLNVSPVTGGTETDYLILSGNANFNELSINDLATISGLPVSANNGTFLVTGVSSDGKTLRVLNPDSVNEYSSGTFTLNSNLTAGDAFTIGGTTLVAGTNFAIGGSASATAANLSAVAGTITNVMSTVYTDIVTITATIPSASIALSYSGVGSVTVSGSSLAGSSYTGSTFSATTGVTEGDTVVFSSPFNVLNQGTYRVIRSYNDSIWIDNADVFEEEVTLGSNAISLGFDGTTGFTVSAANNSLNLSWNQTGTEPSLANAAMGDLVTFGSDFSSGNQGTFMVSSSGVKLQQITSINTPSGSDFTLTGAGNYFLINSANNANQYYVWFNVNSSNSDPAVAGHTGLQVNILSGDNSAQVAAKLATVLNGASDLAASSSLNVVTASTTGYAPSTNASNFNVPGAFSVTTVQSGRVTYLECINPSAVNQSGITITNVLTCYRPQILFSEYDASQPGDNINISSSFLGTGNQGKWPIYKVLDQSNVIVTGTLAAAYNVSLSGNESNFSILEDAPYVGYKHVLLASSQPGATTRDLIVFDTNNNYDKINESAGVQISSLNKLNFPTTLRAGLDSYRYDIGLIREANRLVYGDPRYPATYPGVGAAGANIYHKGPLVRRVQVSISVRLATGVPFAQLAEQVRSNVAGLINSNDVGKSIAISSIIAVVSIIPGVLAVSISSPLYNTSNDLIALTAAEKSYVLDPSLDISVSSI